MKESPLLFMPEMVRAYRAGRKTQTRRILRLQPPENYAPRIPGDFESGKFWNGAALWETVCPYGRAGDRLWGRETWRTTGDGGRADYLKPSLLQPHPVWYEADGPAPASECTGKIRQSIFMPRWACRILAEITEIRVQRLQDISEADAKAEGIESKASLRWPKKLVYRDYGYSDRGILDECEWGQNPIASYRSLWESINGPGSWDLNPWVYAITFKPLEAGLIA